MRSADYDLLGQLLNAASNWRSTAENAGGGLESLTVVFPDGTPVRLDWTIETDEHTNAETGEVTQVILWEGWKVTTPAPRTN